MNKRDNENTSKYSTFSEEKKEKMRLNSRRYYAKNKDIKLEKHKLWAEKNKDYVREYQRNTKRDRKNWAINYLGNCCSICGGSFHFSIYEFHHLNPETKDRDPSKMLQLSLTRLKSELDKCQLVCANCHRFIHHGHK